MTQTIKTINNPHVSQLPQVLKSKIPIKLSGVQFDHGFGQWNKDYLTEKNGDSIVNLVASRSKRFDYNNQQDNGIVVDEVPFKQALETIYSQGDESVCYYMQQCPIRKRLPALVGDLRDINDIFTKKYSSLINMWVGQTGAISPLHFDEHDNFLHQVQGKKVLSLFSPSDSQYLYPNVDADMPHVSLLDLADVCQDSYPLYSKATAYNVELEQGDILFMPKQWWHQVETVDTGISINYWFKKKPLMARLQSLFQAK